MGERANKVTIQMGRRAATQRAVREGPRDKAIYPRDGREGRWTLDIQITAAGRIIGGDQIEQLWSIDILRQPGVLHWWLLVQLDRGL